MERTVLHTDDVTILSGDCRALLPTLSVESVQCVVTSPPYWGLRDYDVGGGIGHEATVDEYVSNMVGIFREVRRVLRNDGVCWVNIGETWRQKRMQLVPARLAIALDADGWIVRDSVVWHKVGATPEGTRDRCSRDYETVLQLTKSEQYFFDLDALRGAHTDVSLARAEYEKRRTVDRGVKSQAHPGRVPANRVRLHSNGRTPGAVWTITPSRFPGAHFATMPPALAANCIEAGSRSSDVVLDPFGGAGTTGLVARALGRKAVLIELNPKYAALAQERLAHVWMPPHPARTKPTTTRRKVQRAAQRTLGFVLRRGQRNASVRHLSQAARAHQAGVSRATQQRLDNLARRAPELLANVAAGILSLRAALGRCAHARRAA